MTQRSERWYEDSAIADAFTPIVVGYLERLQATNEALLAGGRPPRAVAPAARCADTGEPLRWSEDERGFVFDLSGLEDWYTMQERSDPFMQAED